MAEIYDIEVGYDELAALDNSGDLARLDTALRDFNVFDAIGIHRQEVCHSKVLAFLLDRSETHGLGDDFAKSFFSAIAAQVQGPEWNSLRSDIEAGSYRGKLVRTEWSDVMMTGRADILLFAETQSGPVVVVVENKIDAPESPEQLSKYWAAVSRAYPTVLAAGRIFGVFLTPDGRSALTDNPITENGGRFATFSFKDLAWIIHRGGG